MNNVLTMDDAGGKADSAVERRRLAQVIGTLAEYLQGKEKPIELCLIALLAKGHVLIEDMPGIGKTTLAVGLARALGLSFGRIQCTSDLLPSDITGVSVFNRESNRFEFVPGPVFNNLVLIDEINRATPKTQSALLEAMAEEQVTVEGRTYRLPRPFFVIATQNPAEHYGTFPLPESQLDRFIMRINIGYPAPEREIEILRSGSSRERLDEIAPVVSAEQCAGIQEMIERTVVTSDRILGYLLEIVKATRESRYAASGLSTRGALSIVATARAHAFLKDRDYVIPEDVKNLLPATAAHRLVLKDENESMRKEDVLETIIRGVELPL